MHREADTFQHYQVLKHPDGSRWELGRGAMGITYKAFDVNLRCHVALKVVNAQHLHSETARARFLREARAAARLRHNNVASVYHLGSDGQNYFYAMEFIDGETLEALVRRKGPLPASQVILFATQVARALGAAHRQGLVHRDIKPANLMVIHDDDHEGQLLLKVIDFGLARSVLRSNQSLIAEVGHTPNYSGKPQAYAQDYYEGDYPASGVGHASLTMAGFVGTPQYASPEQLEEKDLDIRSDIYSLGVTIWYLLVGAPPFTGTLGSIMSQHITQEPNWQRLIECGVPHPLYSLLQKMLQKSRHNRPQDPIELRQKLEECLIALSTNGNTLLENLSYEANLKNWSASGSTSVRLGEESKNKKNRSSSVFTRAFFNNENVVSKKPKSSSILISSKQAAIEVKRKAKALIGMSSSRTNSYNYTATPTRDNDRETDYNRKTREISATSRGSFTRSDLLREQESSNQFWLITGLSILILFVVAIGAFFFLYLPDHLPVIRRRIPLKQSIQKEVKVEKQVLPKAQTLSDSSSFLKDRKGAQKGLTNGPTNGPTKGSTKGAIDTTSLQEVSSSTTAAAAVATGKYNSESNQTANVSKEKSSSVVAMPAVHASTPAPLHKLTRFSAGSSTSVATSALGSSIAVPNPSLGVMPGAHNALLDATSTNINEGKRMLVKVTSEPSGAEVILQGESLGVTPVTILLSPGKYDFYAHYWNWPEAIKTIIVPSSGGDTLTAEIKMNASK